MNVVFGLKALVKQLVTIRGLEVDTAVRWPEQDGFAKSVLRLIVRRGVEHLPGKAFASI